MRYTAITKTMYRQLVNLYPLVIPRLYVWLRLKILPLDQLEKYLPKTGSILDVGCGYGFSTIYFAHQSPRRLVKGIELNASRVKIAKAASVNIKNVSFQADNLASLQQQKYQTVILIDLLHHLSASEKSKLLFQSHQLLHAKGQLIVKDINKAPLLKYLWNYFHDSIMTKFGRLEFLSSTEMIALLTSCGFNVTNHYPINNFLYPHYLYVCSKS